MNNLDEMKQLELAGKFAAKWANAVLAISTVGKSGHNSHHHYDYARESDVLVAARRALAENKIALLPTLLDHVRDGQNTRVQIQFDLIDCETGYTRSQVWWAEGNDTQDKGINKAITAGLKYFLLRALMIPTGVEADDPDSGDANGKAKSRRTAATTPAKSASTLSAPEGTIIFGYTPSQWPNPNMWAGKSTDVQAERVKTLLTKHSLDERLASPLRLVVAQQCKVDQREWLDTKAVASLLIDFLSNAPTGALDAAVQAAQGLRILATDAHPGAS